MSYRLAWGRSSERIVRRLKRGRPRTNRAIASVTTERVLDGSVLAIFGVIGIVLVPVDGRLRWALLTVSLVFAGLASGIVLGIFAHQRIRSFLAAANRRFPGHVTSFASNKASHFLDGLLALGTVPRTLGALSTTPIIWSLRGGILLLRWTGCLANLQHSNRGLVRSRCELCLDYPLHHGRNRNDRGHRAALSNWFAKKVLSIGIWMVAPSARPLKARSASSGVSTRSVTDEPCGLL